jgi:uncharacterized protein (DUF2062 family)
MTDVVLMVLVVGAIVLALGVDVAALVAWLCSYRRSKQGRQA